MIGTAPKNRDGHLGQPCALCGGYGYTLSLNAQGGGSSGCSACNSTGVQQESVEDLKLQLEQLMKRMDDA